MASVQPGCRPEKASRNPIELAVEVGATAIPKKRLDSKNTVTFFKSIATTAMSAACECLKRYCTNL